LDIHFTASIGVASYPSDAKTKVELLHLADEAMYAIKNSTRNGVAAAKVGVLPVT
jgi:diguanylate cyclase (GGDEF)-like protein